MARPTWEFYARRHNLEIFIVEDPPHREHYYWGKYFPLTLPEFAKIDAVLVLDNDILISPESPSIAEGWDATKIAIADEREQFSWVEDFVGEYYADYPDLAAPARRFPHVLNTGVLLYTREHVAFFEQVFARWLEWRNRASASARARQRLVYAADQPHVSLALQADQRAQVLPSGFNRLWWSWYREHGRADWRIFRAYAKASSMVAKFAPSSMAEFLARPGARALERALDDCHFLHMAGSKSPLQLFTHETTA